MDRVVNKMKNKLSAFKMKPKNHSWGHLIEIKETERSIKINLSSFKEPEESNVVSVILKYRP